MGRLGDAVSCTVLPDEDLDEVGHRTTVLVCREAYESLQFRTDA
jgi:hypothetical protein